MIEKLKDRYKVISHVGVGGMATIYKALDLQTSKYVAIKLLAPDQKENYVHKRRFLSEMRITQKVDSPYVVKIYETCWEDDIQYICMELIEGHILKNYINAHTRLTVEEVVEFAKQLAFGFDDIHKHGIIHRDIKSQNVMVGPHGQIKIIDFGIALTEESERLTKTDSVVGSVQYMAPELADQRPATIQSDIYAFGILIYEMLTGDVPFRGNSALETLMKHKSQAVPYVSKQFDNVPNSLANIVAKATQHDPRERYKTMYDMYKDLNTCLNSERIVEREYQSVHRKRITFMTFINSKKMFYALIGFSAVMVAMAVVVLAVLLS